MKVFSNEPSTLLRAVVVTLMAVTIICLRQREKNEQLLSSMLSTDGRRRLIHRRYFPSGLTCNLYMKAVELGPTSDIPKRHSTHEWFCELSPEDSSRLGVEYPYYLDIADSSLFIPDGAIPGQSALKASEATVDIAKATLHIPEKALVSVESAGLYPARMRNLKQKKGAPTMGKLKTLVIRVIDSKGVAPDADHDQLKDDIFLDQVSLKTQYEACSYGKLRIEPFSGETETKLQIRGGVVDLAVDYDASAGGEVGDRGELQNAAFRAAARSIGDLRGQFDLVLFCMPPGTGNWLAYAFANDNFSFYNNEWCSYVSALLHEVGHNIGLAHSGEDGEGDYFDQQGVMGVSYSIDDQHMCFNPAKSYQLGWYKDKVKSINPLSSDSVRGVGRTGARVFTLNGVSDYRKNDAAIVVLRLEMKSSEKDFYIGYNRKDGINADTAEDGNKVTIVRKESGLPHEFGQSTKIAKLDPGQSVTIRNFNGEGDVKISFIELNDGNARIKVVDLKSGASANESFDDRSCALYKVELTTDSYPDDNRWIIVEDGGIGQVYANSPTYSEKDTLYTNEICLPHGSKCKFVLVDKRKDGFRGGGFYKLYDNQGKVIVSGDASSRFDSFGVQIKQFRVPKQTAAPSTRPSPSPTPPPTPPPTMIPTLTPTPPPTIPRPIEDKCEDAKESPHRITWKVGSRKLTCQEINKEKKCDVIWFKTDKPLWQICQKSCRRCGKQLSDSEKNLVAAHKTSKQLNDPSDLYSKPSDINSPEQEKCKDARDILYQITWKEKARKLTCWEIHQRELCDEIWFKTDKPLWHLCQKSCDRCESTITRHEQYLAAMHAVPKHARTNNNHSIQSQQKPSRGGRKPENRKPSKTLPNKKQTIRKKRTSTGNRRRPSKHKKKMVLKKRQGPEKVIPAKKSRNKNAAIRKGKIPRKRKPVKKPNDATPRKGNSTKRSERIVEI